MQFLLFCLFNGFFQKKTIRDQPKSAPYLWLKNSKRTSKCQSIRFDSTRKKFLNKSHNTKKTVRDLLGQFNIHSVAKLQKNEGGHFGEFFSEKSLAMPKKLKVRPFSLFRYCMLRGNPFWFSTLGQQVQFGVFLKFCRTFGRTKKSADKKLIECLPGVAFLKKSAQVLRS